MPPVSPRVQGELLPPCLGGVTFVLGACLWERQAGAETHIHPRMLLLALHTGGLGRPDPHPYRRSLPKTLLTRIEETWERWRSWGSSAPGLLGECHRARGATNRVEARSIHLALASVRLRQRWDSCMPYQLIDM